MIQPNELRIGNCVYFDTRLDKITSLGQTLVVAEMHSHYYYERIHPVPLTPELLEKFGFVEHSHVNQDQDDVEWMQHPALPDLRYRDGLFRLEYFELSHIQHFHQLQNLFFCLTGEELTVKL